MKGKEVRARLKGERQRRVRMYCKDVIVHQDVGDK